MHLSLGKATYLYLMKGTVRNVEIEASSDGIDAISDRNSRIETEELEVGGYTIEAMKEIARLEERSTS